MYHFISSAKVLISLIFMFLIPAAYPQNFLEHQAGRMNMLSSYFLFEEEEEAYKCFIENNNPEGYFNVKMENEKGFSIKLLVDIKNFDNEKIILEIPGILKVYLRYADLSQWDKQNYAAFKMNDDAVPILEASLKLYGAIEKPLGQDMTIGFPLSRLPKIEGKHEIVLNFTGVQWTLFIDNELADNDFPIGYPRWEEENRWTINPEYVENATIFFPAFKCARDLTQINNDMPYVQYWTPRGHNSWVGDVTTIYYADRYHVFYLFDRRHHASKFGVGGHYFEHFSTTDFKIWTEHEAATPIEKQWETFGTGTPFVFNDKLYISYGLHTSRIYPDEITMHPLQIDYFNKNKKTGFFRFDSDQLFPSGATYSVSEDGLSSFQKSGVLFHYCENPSVYVTDNGKLRLFANYRAKGTWESETIEGGWKCINEDFPPGGDCTFYFQWGNFEYIIGGFVDLWMKRKGSPDDSWVDMVNNGLDFYNGINVPSVSKIKDGRFLMAGWFPIRGWGGPFVIHEMIQYPDGRIGTKWMNELIPEIVGSKILAKKIIKESIFPIEVKSFMLTFNVHPKKKNKGKLALSFLSSHNKKNSCEFQIDLSESFAQYTDVHEKPFVKKELSLREGGAPHHVRNYAIENLIGINKPFSVRIIAINNSKFGGTVIDAEIAGQRTMITFRPDLHINDIVFNTEGIELSNIQLYKIK